MQNHCEVDCPVSRSALLVRDVRFAYAHNEPPVIDGVDLEVRFGECVVLMGASGCGKTTLLHLIQGNLRPLGGSIQRLVRHVGFVYQRDGLLPWYKSEDNVALPRVLAGHSWHASRAEARLHLRDVGAESCEGKYPHQLSGGMERRVQIARLLCQRAQLWLADEPLESLDVPSRISLAQLIARAQREATAAVVLTTHQVDEALALADRIAILTQYGRLDTILDIKAPRPRAIGDTRLADIRADLFGVLARHASRV